VANCYEFVSRAEMFSRAHRQSGAFAVDWTVIQCEYHALCGYFLTEQQFEGVRMKDRQDQSGICPASLPESHHTDLLVHLVLLVFVPRAARRQQS